MFQGQFQLLLLLLDKHSTALQFCSLLVFLPASFPACQFVFLLEMTFSVSSASHVLSNHRKGKAVTAAAAAAANVDTDTNTYCYLPSLLFLFHFKDRELEQTPSATFSPVLKKEVHCAMCVVCVCSTADDKPLETLKCSQVLGQSPVSQPEQNCEATCITTLNKETEAAAASKLTNCSIYPLFHLPAQNAQIKHNQWATAWLVNHNPLKTCPMQVNHHHHPPA